MEDNKLNSYHIFMFPFKWDYKAEDKALNEISFEKRTSVEKVQEILEEGEWEEGEFDVNKEDRNYNEYVYFHEHVRRVVYNNKDNRVTKYFYYEGGENGKYNITIKKGDRCIKSNLDSIDEENKLIFGYDHLYLYKKNNKKELCIFDGLMAEEIDEEVLNDYEKIELKDVKISIEDEKKLILEKDSEVIVRTDNIKEKLYYSLELDGVALRLYDTGIGVLSYHLKNSRYSKKEDILKINEYGRRIYPQYLPINKVKNSFLADRLELKMDKKDPICEDFEGGCGPSDDYELGRLSKTVMDLLGDKFREKDFIGKSVKKGEVVICPVIDDRMFTISWYLNDEIANELKRSGYRGEYKYLKDDFWHRYTFVDGGDKSCHHRDMFKDFNRDITYERWVDYGSFFGITRYSFVFLGYESDFNNDVILTHIRTMYYQLVVLALVQRASILRFSEEVFNISELEEKKNIYNLVDRIRELHKHYIQFINKIYFRDITAQEQGAELYNKLLQAMDTEREIKDLDNEIDELHKYATLIEENERNKRLNWLTIIGALFVIPSFFTGFFGMNIVDINNELFTSDGPLTLGRVLSAPSFWDWAFTYLVLPATLIGFFIWRLKDWLYNFYRSKKKVGNVLFYLLIFISFLVSLVGIETLFSFINKFIKWILRS
ncbi:CorA family divalent cation transporter [Halonatronum saccharophilum]|uniref:CorA family divalent cation transporter n=1 Tax=Halonatronum saccharophilum TaxID=150060 RepID=UPI0004879FBA|nr:CorA family divalent cation transporter [Halonatronum saccharophilum]